MRLESETLEKVKKLVQKLGIVYLATADREGIPHIAASAECRLQIADFGMKNR